MDASDNGDQSAASSRASSPGQSQNHPHYADNDNISIADSSMMEGPNRTTKSRPPRKSNANAGSAVAMQTIGKIRHLKKEDGEPLWRKDIQYDFLKAVFDNEKAVFTNRYMDVENTPKQNFADLYIDTMSRSSKTSKVLRDKLLSDREAAKSMAMVCLLVNVGRMNTTLNFFPEMRAQLRTYHAIPSLQAYQDASAYKQLQDAPRLKSILKGAAEDNPEPHSLGDFKNRSVPRTNPVNLIFLMCQHAQQVAELHFPPEGEFHDLIMKTNFSSDSRANAFLWLMWFYLESDFTEEGCEENPFGPGVDYGTEVANQGIPRLVEMTAEEEAAENNDPEAELEFGREKQAHRAKIIAVDAAYIQEHQPKARTSRAKLLDDSPAGAAILPRIRPSKHESDLDSNRSTPPPRALGRLGASSAVRRGGASLKYQIFDHSSPAAPSHMVIDGVVPRKPRPPTAHQLAVEHNRSQRVDHILDRGLRKERYNARKLRRREGAIIRAKHRLDAMPEPLVDSDGEDYRAVYDKEKNGNTFRGRGLGGLCQLSLEDDDFGEEIASYAAALRRVGRRLARWEASGNKAVVRPIKKRVPKPEADMDGDELETPDPEREPRDMDRHESAGKGNVETNGNANGDVTMEDADELNELDDMERALLGLEQSKDEDGDEELDDVEKALLGGDDDEEESEE